MVKGSTFKKIGSYTLGDSRMMKGLKGSIMSGRRITLTQSSRLSIMEGHRLRRKKFQKVTR